MQTEKEKGLSIGSSKKKILIKYYYERIRRDVTNFIKWMLLAILTGLVVGGDRKSTRLNSSHPSSSRMPSSA